MSLFIAVPAPEELRDHLAGYAEKVAEIAPEARLVKPENWHMTLAFLGRGEEEADVARAAAALDGLVARDFPFDVAGIGLFPNRAPNAGECVVWARVEEVPRLRECHREMLGLLRDEGFRIVHEPFRAHLTLARRATIAHGAELSELEFEKPSFYAPARRVCLMRGVPAEDGGVRYEIVRERRLATDGER